MIYELQNCEKCGSIRKYIWDAEKDCEYAFCPVCVVYQATKYTTMWGYDNDNNGDNTQNE